MYELASAVTLREQCAGDAHVAETEIRRMVREQRRARRFHLPFIGSQIGAEADWMKSCWMKRDGLKN